MKNTYTSVFSTACVAILIQSTSVANISGSDNFNDNSNDTAKWDTDYGFTVPSGGAAGALTETNGRLQFSSTGTGTTYESRPWKANFGSYTSNWDVQLDTVIPSNSGLNNGIGFGLEIWKTGVSPTTTPYVGIEHDNFGQAPEYFSYRGTVQNTPLDTASSTSALTLGAVRISFNATSKVLTTFFDADGPSNGYQWTLEASYGVASSGGVTGNDNWGMTASDTFTIVPFGYSAGVAATAGQTYGDNFLATPEPSTSALLLGASLLLSCRRKAITRNG